MKYDVKINSLRADGNVRAYASVNLNDEFAITGIKVMDSSKGKFVSMPSYKSNGEYRDVCFPITKEAREQLNDAVLRAYEQALEQLHSQTPKQNDMPTQSEGELMQEETESASGTGRKTAKSARAPKSVESQSAEPQSPEMTTM